MQRIMAQSPAILCDFGCLREIKAPIVAGLALKAASVLDVSVCLADTATIFVELCSRNSFMEQEHPCCVPGTGRCHPPSPRAAVQGFLARSFNTSENFLWLCRQTVPTTVIRGAGAALMRSAEAEVLCVGGWFTRLFPGQWQNSFHFSPVQNLSQ